MTTYRYHGPGRKTGKRHSGRRIRGWWAGIPSHQPLIQYEHTTISKSLECYHNLPRPKIITYTPTMIELMEAGKNWLIPPSTMITATAMLTNRLWTIVSYRFPHNQAKPSRKRLCWKYKRRNIQNVGEIHFGRLCIATTYEQEGSSSTDRSNVGIV